MLPPLDGTLAKSLVGLAVLLGGGGFALATVWKWARRQADTVLADRLSPP